MIADGKPWRTGLTHASLRCGVNCFGKKASIARAQVGKTAKYEILTFPGHRVISSNIEQKNKNGVGGALYLYSRRKQNGFGSGWGTVFAFQKNKTILGYVGVMISIVNRYIK